MTDQNEYLYEIAMQKLKRHQNFNKTGTLSKIDYSFRDVEELAETFRLEVTQFSHTTGDSRIAGYTSGAASLSHVHLPQETTVRTELNRDSVSFTLPLNAGDMWKVNGVIGSSSVLFFNTNVDETYIYAKRRVSIIGHVRKKRFLYVLGALLGKPQEAVLLPSGAVQLAPVQRQKLVAKMGSWVPRHQSKKDLTADFLHADDLESDVAHLLASAAIESGYGVPSEASGGRSCIELVRKAETHFENLGSGTLGLADLCSAAQVSAPTLITAFREATGTTPMRFFTLKRLSRVRNELLSGRATVSAVKQAGLRHGFVELGRMSALYRTVYGENPSQTARDY